MRVCNRYGFERFYRRTEESDLPHRLGMRRLLTDEWDDINSSRRCRRLSICKKAERLLNRRIGQAWIRVQAELEALLRRECRNALDRQVVRRWVLETIEPEVGFRRPNWGSPDRPDYFVDAAGFLRRFDEPIFVSPTSLFSADELRTEPDVIRKGKRKSA